ncbi:hypothetical protein [Nesterenkonia sp. K-15-9-6]|uniref:hypothetical protein n=1 Tax=Nesterenkonia sp. K-15-9-6 TaxID=3093918 RepID=UPI0040447E25
MKTEIMTNFLNTSSAVGLVPPVDVWNQYKPGPDGLLMGLSMELAIGLGIFIVVSFLTIPLWGPPAERGLRKLESWSQARWGKPGGDQEGNQNGGQDTTPDPADGRYEREAER